MKKRKFKRGDQVVSVAEIPEHDWFIVKMGARDKTMHREVLRSWSIRTCEQFIDNGRIFIALRLTNGEFYEGMADDEIKEMLDRLTGVEKAGRDFLSKYRKNYRYAKVEQLTDNLSQYVTGGENDAEISARLKAISSAEEPLSEKFLMKRCLSSLGIQKYGQKVEERLHALIGLCAAFAYLKDETFRQQAGRRAEALIARMDPNSGNIPAEHYEAPAGANLVDMIYTVNWALLGLCAARNFRPEFQTAYERVLNLVLSIQDTSPQPQFHGCWRGMFDLDAGTWGGGNRFEGGAASIYSGWTNAPVSWVLANELNGKAVFDGE